MRFGQVRNVVENALHELLTRDAKLFELDASEWALAHRLAVYLEQQLAGWDVDCEYNRQGLAKHSKQNSSNEIIRPDVVVHHRGECAIRHNVLVIEVKKDRNPGDEEKARAYTESPSNGRRFQYQYGLALSFRPTVDLTWYKNGNPINLA